MSKMLRVVEVMWAVIAAVSAYEIYNQWGINRDRAYMFAAFMALAIFMFFFRRRTRMRHQARQQENDLE